MFENGKVYRSTQQNGSNEWIMDYGPHPPPLDKDGIGWDRIACC